MRRLVVIASLSCLAACAGGPAPVGAASRDVAPRPAAGAAPSAQTPRAARSGRPYAPSPVTAVGDALTDYALSALGGGPLPPPPVPLSGPLGAPPPIAWRTDARPSDVHVLGVAFELELVLKRGVPDPDAEAPDRFGAIRATLVLSRGGLRVVGLRPRMLAPRDRAGRLPSAMAPFEEVARELLAAVRAEDIGVYRLSDEDRALLDNDTVWTQMVEDRVPAGRVRLLARMLAALPDEPIAYLVDDVAVLVRDVDGSLYSLAFDFDPSQGSFALQTEPLLEVRRLWPL